MSMFLSALCLALALEGVCFALFPERMREAMARALELPDNALRGLGATALALAAIGAFLLSIFRRV